MKGFDAFESYADLYDRWFDKHRWVYESELDLLRRFVPKEGRGLEVGSGTGRFQAPLAVDFGIEPSKAMGKIATDRNLVTVGAVAEALPFAKGTFDYLLYVTADCFFSSLERALEEAHRVLKRGGSLIIALIDRERPLGREYEKGKGGNHFFKKATLHSVNEVVFALKDARFGNFFFGQTLFKPLKEIKAKEPLKKGFGEGAFVVIKAAKP